MRANVSYTSREQIEVYKFSPLVSVGVPLLALFLQSFLPVRFHLLSIFDLPLLVTIFFGMARRNQLAGLDRSDYRTGAGRAHPRPDWNLRYRQDGYWLCGLVARGKD